ncbi:epithelial cell adhesion molecule isoform X2 [Electrophorus electricus]|nr:epithelial cell adhesion molecule isoform X2 [Electrophorus electricus]
MRAEMHRLRHHPSSLSQPTQMPVAHDGAPYDPQCGSDGLFRARQCDEADVCWCVDGLGVRRSHMGARSLEGEELVEASWVQVEVKHRGQQLPGIFAAAEYDVDACLITLDVKRNVGNQTHELSQLANYMEKDVNMQLLFDDLVKIEQTIAGEKLEMESIQAYYVGEEAASTTTQRLSGTMLTLSVALILAVLLGLLIQLLIRRQKQGKYEKAQTSEMEEI